MKDALPERIRMRGIKGLLINKERGAAKIIIGIIYFKK